MSVGIKPITIRDEEFPTTEKTKEAQTTGEPNKDSKECRRMSGQVRLDLSYQRGCDGQLDTRWALLGLVPPNLLKEHLLMSYGMTLLWTHTDPLIHGRPQTMLIFQVLLEWLAEKTSPLPQCHKALQRNYQILLSLQSHFELVL